MIKCHFLRGTLFHGDNYLVFTTDCLKRTKLFVFFSTVDYPNPRHNKIDTMQNYWGLWGQITYTANCVPVQQFYYDDCPFETLNLIPLDCYPTSLLAHFIGRKIHSPFKAKTTVTEFFSTGMVNVYSLLRPSLQY